MRAALAAVSLLDGDVSGNLARMAKAAREAKTCGASLCVFGECAVQGFNALSWEYEADRDRGISADSEAFRRLCALSRGIGIDLLFGYIERDGDALYSSCALIEDGILTRNYRRVSRGWKEFRRTDSHYREGDGPLIFDYRGIRCLAALCGDLWDSTAPLFQNTGADLLLWPVYICYSPEEWENGIRREYAEKAAEFAPRALLVNSLCRIRTQNGGEETDAWGGCACFEGGKTTASLPMDRTGILFAEL